LHYTVKYDGLHTAYEKSVSMRTKTRRRRSRSRSRSILQSL